MSLHRSAKLKKKPNHVLTLPALELSNRDDLKLIDNNETVSPTYIPAERFGTIEDIGGLVMYLVSRAVSESRTLLHFFLA